MNTAKPVPDVICVDWGTTSFRAYLVRGGLAVAETQGPSGILTVEQGTHAAVLKSLLAILPCDASALPIIMSGMIGSRQGWREAPYVAAPASVRQIAARLVTWREAGLGAISLIPGVMQEPEGGMPDVMRGEETQVLGALGLLGISEGTFILPGTHSKCIKVRMDRLVSFRSFMTGEIFAALKDHTILGRLMTDGPATGEGFRAGVLAAKDVARAGDLLNAVFGTRTLGLFGRLAGHELAHYLSGLLIGAELCAALAEGEDGIVIGTGALTGRYVEAAALLGKGLRPAPEACVVAGQLAVLEAAR